MAIVEGQKIDIKWHGLNKKHFEEKGYVFTKFGDRLTVDVKDLMPSQDVLVKVVCDYCKKEKESKYNKTIKKEHHYCDNSCMFKLKQQKGILPPKEHDYCCDCCNKEFKVENYRFERLLSGEYKNLFCSKECSLKYNSENQPKNRKKPSEEKIIKKCECCGDEFKIIKSRENRAKYCSEDCKRNASKTSKIVKCDNCGCDTEKIQSVVSRNKNLFCSPECSNEFKIKQGNEERKCECCDRSYSVNKSSKQRFCSMECQSEWQSKVLIGENANNFDSNLPMHERVVKCDWCNEDTIVKSPFKYKAIQNGARHFCSKECKQEWFAKDWSQQEEWKIESRERAVRTLSKQEKTMTSPQVVVNNLLDQMCVDYVNEYNCKYVSIDSYLIDYNLMIEVMGTYWHTDHRFYDEINYQMQVDRIKNDKIKNKYIKNNHAIDILYLWEFDCNNVELIRQLINLYIKNKGVLENYHSFNYFINEDGVITLNNQFKTPYMEYEIEKLKDIINYKTKPRNSKQLDKWITFNCDNCGEEKEQLISRFNKSKNHFCSQKCKNEFKK